MNVNRRQFLRWLSLMSAGVLAPGLKSAAVKGDELGRPNVLFIAIDDLNDWVGCLGGHPDTDTPNLDALAARGTIFTQAYCPAPLCNPSRTSVLTGLLPSTSGVYSNEFEHEHFRNIPALSDWVTLPQYFMQHGYHVMGAGKVFHWADSASWNEAFHEFPEGYVPGIDTRPDDAQGHKNGLDELHGNLDWGPVDVPDTETGDWKTVNWATNKLDQEYDQPFFLAIGLFRPHLPWYLPPAWFDRQATDDITLPDTLPNDLSDVPPVALENSFEGREHYQDIIQNAGKWQEAVAAYLASIHFMDARLGELIAALDRSRYAENTIIVLWSDHGWLLGEKSYWSKDVLWEEALRIPLIFAGPGLVQAGSRCDQPVSTVSIYRTLIDLCGMPPRDDLEGQSLAPLLQNPGADWDGWALSTRRYQEHSVRTKSWRYTRYADGAEELYDHEFDPLEWINLAGDEQYDAVKHDLAQHLPNVNTLPLR